MLPNLKAIRTERVALARVAGVEAGGEPVLALGARAVRERVGSHTAAGLLLDGVVADRAGGVDRILDVLLGDRLEQRLALGVLGFRGVVGPDAGVAVGLKFQANRAGRGA